MRLTTAVAALAALLPLAVAECPKGCSGHGQCDTSDACVCYSGFTGADCTERTCPFGTAFVDTARGDLNHDGVVAPSLTSVSKAYSKTQWSAYRQYEVWPTIGGTYSSAYRGTAPDQDIDPTLLQGGGWAAAANEAHFYAECSGKGSCNRQTGACACFDGYEGGACQRTTCPGGCSGHGTCTLVADLASGGFFTFADSRNTVNYYDGVLKPFTYNLWDAQKNTKCVCDAGYSGADCSLRLCPRGDDPLTVTNPVCGNKACQNEIQGFTIAGGANNDKKMYRIRFYDYEGVFYFTAPFSIGTTYATGGTPSADAATNTATVTANAVAVKNALEAIPMGVAGNVTVACAFDATSTKNMRCTVTFKTLPGNVPEFVVEPITGAPVIAQPSQPVHVFSGFASIGSTSVSVQLFPDDSSGFRLTQFTGSAATVTVATAADVKSLIDSAIQGASNGPSAFVYKHGTTSVSVAVDGPNPYTYLATNYNDLFTIVVVMPSKSLGGNPMRLSITPANGASRPAGAAAQPVSLTSTMDTIDGNKEASVCSNRGLCDYSSGLCKCFGGYTGYTCETPDALAM